MHTHIRTEDVPSPSEVQLLFINISSVLITWSYPTTEHAHFLVQRSYDGDSYRNDSSLIYKTHYTSTGLKFGAYYEYRVIALLEGVASPPTENNFFINGVTGKIFKVHVYIHSSNNTHTEQIFKNIIYWEVLIILCFHKLFFVR